MKSNVYEFKVTGLLMVTADNQQEAEERMMSARERLEHTLNEVECTLEDTVENDGENK